jgi:hypothetical protein
MQTIRYQAEHDNRVTVGINHILADTGIKKYPFSWVVPNLRIPVCQACGEKVFTEDVDQQIEESFKAQKRPKYNKGITLRHKESGTTYVVVDVVQFPSGMIGYELHSTGYPADIRHFESEVDRNFEEGT